jgi:hypothetical protein
VGFPTLPLPQAPSKVENRRGTPAIDVLRQQLQTLTAVQERRDALVASWMPVMCDGSVYYHERGVRTLYPPAFTYTFAPPIHTAPSYESYEPARPFAWGVCDPAQNLVATHRAYSVLTPTPHAVIDLEPERTHPAPADAAPPASPELLAALALDA